MFEMNEEGRFLYMCPAGGDGERLNVAAGDMQGMQVIPGAFDRVGPKLLQNRGQILVLDELGYLEKDERLFQDAVFQALDGDGPVLGVLREGFPGWTAQIAARPDVEVLTVTEENRDEIPLAILSRFLGLNLAAVIMAAGRSERFGSNKLMAEVEGIPMIAHVFRALPLSLLKQVVVVARDAAVLEMAAHRGFCTISNDDPENDPARTIRLGMGAAETDCAGCLFLVGDQPQLKKNTVLRLAEAFLHDPAGIHVPVDHEGRRGNPVFFPAAMFGELKNLPPHQRGKVVIANHPELVRERETESAELSDVDYASDLKCSENRDCAL